MKILVNCPLPFALAHGGHQIQIQRTLAALQAGGVQTEPVRWWDEHQTGDLIHYFGRMPVGQVKLAQQKNIKVIIGELLTEQGSRSALQLRVQKIISHAIERFAPGNFIYAFNWESYRLADACIALTPWEADLMHSLFGAPRERIHVLANGVEDVFLNSPKAARGKWLVCAATITERKRVLELAEAAVRARTPVWIVGGAYSENEHYAQKFFALARQHPQFVRHEGPVPDRAQLAQIYREARGFVLLSNMESLSLSALEAAACECPLLLSDLPWARCAFGDAARYCPVTKSAETTAKGLRDFYDAAPGLPAPPKPASWNEIGRQLKQIYQKVIGISR